MDQKQRQSGVESGNNISTSKASSRDNTTFSKASNHIDIKGAIALTITVASFLLVLTLLETSGSNIEAVSVSNGNDNYPSNANSSALVLPFLIIGIIAFAFFVITQFSGISLGMSSLMRIVGSSIGPALAGMYMQANQALLNLDGIMTYFPSSLSFNLIFLSTVIVSVVSIALAIILRQRATKMAIPNLT